MEHTCNKEADISAIKTHVEYHSDMLFKMDNKMDKLASKRELNIHRWLIGSAYAAIGLILSLILEKIK